MNTKTKFNLPIGFYTTFHTRNKFNENKSYYETIELIKVNDKTITIKRGNNKPIIRKPKQTSLGFHFPLENYSTMGRWEIPIFSFKDAYYTKHKPTQEELEKNFVAGEIIF